MQGACRGQSERQYDGCDCFGSHTAFLRNAGLSYSSSKNHWNWCRIRRVCWTCLATGWRRSQQLKKRSRSTSTRSLVQRMLRGRRHRVPSNRSSEAQDRTTPGSRDGQRKRVTCLYTLLRLNGSHSRFPIKKRMFTSSIISTILK